ncbi:hypothetical protein NKH18_46120 [Streptomyces sp. M10(2022)]
MARLPATGNVTTSRSGGTMSPAALRGMALRALELVGVLFIVSVGVFSLVVLMPGDPVVDILGAGEHPPSTPGCATNWAWTSRCTPGTSTGWAVS